MTKTVETGKQIATKMQVSWFVCVLANHRTNREGNEKFADQHKAEIREEDICINA